MEIIASIILIVVVYCMCKMPEWKSDNYIPPKGIHTDFKQASADITLHGKDYYYRKHAIGGYNISNEK